MTLAVLQSFPTPRATTNPYIHMLAAALRATDGVELYTFDWRTALTTHYQVLHAHWPENLIKGRHAWARRALFALLLLKCRLGRTAIVRTQHNLERPSELGRIDNALLGWFERATKLVIKLNPTTPTTKPSVLIPLGHYRDWYAAQAHLDPSPKAICFFGLVRRYKGVPQLLKAMRALPDPEMRLRVVGNPSTAALADELHCLAAGDERISLELRFVSEADLVAAATSAQLIVLPYSDMHNSAGALTALSLGRPVLVPSSAANQHLSIEVGPGWVHQFDGELSPAALAAAIEAGIPDQQPNLSGREWAGTGEAHLDAYRQALT